MWLLTHASAWASGWRGATAVAWRPALRCCRIVVYTFYLMQPPIHRNYGGMTSGLRWMFWFAPLWLVATAAGGRLVCPGALAALAWRSCCLGLSVLSASYPTWNPWTHPWILNFMLDRGWITL